MPKLKVMYEGILDLANCKIPCYVLEDGTRVLSGRQMQTALKLADDIPSSQSAGSRLQRYLNQKSLRPYLYRNEDENKYIPIICYKGNTKINGYKATDLVDLCDGFLEARKNTTLSSRQKIIADQAEILMRSFAKIGIISLIDEATGYQYEREADTLQKLLKLYISEELLPWQKTFPDIYYKELFRLNGWDFTEKGISKRPGVIGTWTNKLIYDELPDGIAEELKKKVPISKSGNKLARYFQFLTDDYGSPHLKAQINKIITIFNMSDNMEDMWKNFEKAKSRQMNYLEPPYKFDENGHTVENDDDLPETPKSQIVTETFTSYLPKSNQDDNSNNKE